MQGLRYCECFASRSYCEDCNCVGCSNTSNQQEAVRAAVISTLDRNPKAFTNKIKYASEVGCTVSMQPRSHSTQPGETPIGLHHKGCHCKKSHCQKRYCECFQAGVHCGDNCRCVECHNHDGTRPSPPSRRRQSLSPPHKRMRPSSVPVSSVTTSKCCD